MAERFCPVCGSTEIEPYAGFVSASYKCKKCGYVGNFFPEKVKRGEKGKKRFKSKSS